MRKERFPLTSSENRATLDAMMTRLTPRSLAILKATLERQPEGYFGTSEDPRSLDDLLRLQLLSGDPIQRLQQLLQGYRRIVPESARPD